MKNILALILLMVCTGCASRDFPREGHPLKPVVNLYSRNFVVAAPTRVGNYLCGAPVFLIGTPLTGWSNTAGKIVWDTTLVVGSICGFFTGSLFIPVSYLCDENPWHENIQFYRRSWSCRKEPS